MTKLKMAAPRRVLGALAVASLAFSLVSCGDDDSKGAESTTCSYSEGGQPAAKKVDVPDSTASRSGTVEATLATSVGDLELALDADGAPCTVNSFVSLAEQGYFDGTTCHRLVTEGIYVLQCGDPTGTGTGGPGYSYDDELDGDETYPAGTLAMANAGADTNGSQFFIVYEDTELPPSYTVFGTVSDATVQKVAEVAAAGNADDGVAPATAVDISKVTLG